MHVEKQHITLKVGEPMLDWLSAPDLAAALAMHEKEAHPELFYNRFTNQLMPADLDLFVKRQDDVDAVLKNRDISPRTRAYVSGIALQYFSQSLKRDVFLDALKAKYDVAIEYDYAAALNAEAWAIQVLGLAQASKAEMIAGLRGIGWPIDDVDIAAIRGEP